MQSSAHNILLHIFARLNIFGALKDYTSSSQIPPGPPVIDGPQVIVLNSQITLTCTSARGDPPPTVKWLKDDQEITTGISTTTAGTAVTTSLTFTATLDDHIEVYECQAENGVLQNPLSTTKYIEVHFSPQAPTLSGPTTLTPGQSGTWKCISANGYPAGIMTMRNKNKNTQFTSEFTSSSVLANKNSYSVTGTLTWSPVTVNNGDTICCDVSHTTTLGNIPQTVCIEITIARTPPVTFIPQPSYTQILGQQIILGCTVQSPNSAFTGSSVDLYQYSRTNDRPYLCFKFKWKVYRLINQYSIFDHKHCGINRPRNIQLSSENTYVLQSDCGNYVYRSIDAVMGNIVNTDTIKVNSIDLITINAPVTKYIPILQSSVTLQCVVTQGTASQIIWIKDNVQLNIGSNSRLTGGTVATKSLTIANVQQSDGGNYVCRGIDAVTGVTVNTDTISVTPVVQSPNSALQEVQWTFTNIQGQTIDPISVSNSNGKYTGSSINTPSLIINTVESTDQGTYSYLIAINAPVTQYIPILQSSVTLQCVVTQGLKQGQVKEKEDVRYYDGLDPDRQEMHVYNTPQDNEDNNHYMTLPADHAYIDPIC
ncbi:unnamed protein product [Mytilus edulis]|uniref:Ig-like domain-containing protein n=1 Tax=Mytilus edulis TaxID=6550 RepID=A0A8S3QES6_MYTED|nr:unnamed protein product [Mytilus edulis]